MNALYSTVADIDRNALGEPRTTNWKEWVEKLATTNCSYCGSIVKTTDFFCHYCGSGIKPKPCFHPPQPESATASGCPPADDGIEPEMVIFDHGDFRSVKIRCPKCGRETSPHSRSGPACYEWNRMDLNVLRKEVLP